MSTTQARAGTPSPQNWIIHERLVNADSKAIQNVASLYEGATCVDSVPMSALVKCAGASRGRVRFKANVGGDLKLEFVRPQANNYAVTAYESGNPAPVAVTADVETLISTAEIYGEASVLITFTPNGAGAVTLIDWMAL